MTERDRMMAKLFHKNDFLNDREAAGDEMSGVMQSLAELDSFEQEYDDVLSDPKLKQYIFDVDERLVKAGDRRSPGQRARALGEYVRAWKRGAGTVDVEAVRAIQMG